jgi:2-methylisocitrate lyase-like PEP mutase family enzyme
VFERAGAAGIQIEDQVFPKKCRHFAGKAMVPLADMIGKMKAAVDTSRDGDLQIVARTDARALLGLDAAIERTHAMVETGADVTFVEAPTSRAKIERILRDLPVPQVVNVVFGGRTPEVAQQDMKKLGAGMVLHANAALQAANRWHAGGAFRPEARRLTRGGSAAGLQASTSVSASCEKRNSTR